MLEFLPFVPFDFVEASLSTGSSFIWIWDDLDPSSGSALTSSSSTFRSFLFSCAWTHRSRRPFAFFGGRSAPFPRSPLLFMLSRFLSSFWIISIRLLLFLLCFSCWRWWFALAFQWRARFRSTFMVSSWSSNFPFFLFMFSGWWHF